MEKVKDKWVRIGGVVLLSINLLLLGSDQRSAREELVYAAVYIASVILILETGRFIILYFHKRFEDPAHRSKRFWQTCVTVTISYFILIVATFYFSHFVRDMRPNSDPLFLIAVLFGSFVLAMIHVGIYEGFYNFYRIRKLEHEKEELLRINLQNQFDSLKQQVNPHFLFNSINTVSSLIDNNPEQAKKFLGEMSKVYRYLLQANEERLVTLETELQFLGPYFHLFKTRFSEGLQLNLHIDEKYKSLFLPALTLQLLIENAVKHNIIERDRPLIIDISIASNGFLQVKNNLQKKKQNVLSTRIGLANIITKYRLLNRQEVVIEETDKEFKVLVPLFQSN